jgi:5-methylcytosine-specific restriction endonuclease McrA
MAKNDDIRAVLLYLFGNRCMKCGHRSRLIWKEGPRQLCVDHIIPWTKGGTDEIKNRQLLCQSCNCGKKDHLGEWDFRPKGWENKLNIFLDNIK